MKRKVTDLEQKLIQNDFRLLGKEYGGKHSQKTVSYIYQRGDEYIKLDHTRTRVIGFFFEHRTLTINQTTLLMLNAQFKGLNDFVSSLIETPKKVSGETLVNEIHDALDRELPQEKLPPMTPEQLDELNQEKEQANESDID